MRKRHGSFADFINGFGQGFSVVGAVTGALQDAAAADAGNAAGKTDTTDVMSGADAQAAGQNAYQQALAGAQTDEDKASVTAAYQPTLDALQKDVASPARTVYSMGSGANYQQRDNSFSPADIVMAKGTAQADALMGYGRVKEASQVLADTRSMRDLQDAEAVRSALKDDRVQQSPTGGLGDGKTDDLQPYLDHIAPKVTKTLIQQGQLDKAKAFSDFIETNQGRDYAKSWGSAMRKVSTGDYEGAVPHLVKLYDQVPDGKHVEAQSLGDGKYQLNWIDTNTGQQVATKTMTADDLAHSAVMVLAPEKMVQHFVSANEQRSREGALLDRQVQLEQLRQQGQETREDRRDNRLEMRLAAQGSGGGGLTTAQQRTNDSIVAARRQLTGMTPDELLRRTQSTTATGRTNDAYDPQLARAAKLAQTRLYGDDPAHDAWTTQRQQQTQQVAQQPQQGSRQTLPTGLPSGSKQIGTSGGKPVYQLPDGRRVVQE